jgi:hypothetical protein
LDVSTYRGFRAKLRASGPEDALNLDGRVKPQVALDTAFIALSRSMSVRSTVSKATFPFREPPSLPSNSIHLI